MYFRIYSHYFSDSNIVAIIDVIYVLSIYVDKCIASGINYLFTSAYREPYHGLNLLSMMGWVELCALAQNPLKANALIDLNQF
jgi:hypothetical protein